MPSAPKTFVHLHNHTEFSLLDGASRIPAMVKRAAELEMPALALTDHGVMYGAIAFYNACRAAGIKPILGFEAYVAPRSRLSKEGRVDRDPYHLTLLAKDAEGYRNLMRLCSAGQMEGMYYKPRIDRDLLAECAKGVICLSGCLAGEVAARAVAGEMDELRETVATYRDIFGADRYFLEVQRHGIGDQEKVNQALQSVAGEFGLRLVATNDLHYVHQHDHEAHDVLLCLQTGNDYDDPNRWRFDSDSFYLKTPPEMAETFPDLPDALAATLDIADDVSLDLELGHSLLPPFEVPEGHTTESYLRELVQEGMTWRFGEHPPPEAAERMQTELDVIGQTGYGSYFLIVWDFFNFARKHGVVTGPGRGSAAGSLVAYCLGITNLDPLYHGLIFERFLNKDRVSMPDIDSDFSVEGREKVINYVTDKYGKDRVAQIVTFTTMASKAAIRDVGRVLGVPLKECDRLAKLVPIHQGRSKSLGDALEEVPEFHQAYESGQQTSPDGRVYDLRRLIDVARGLEGVSRNVSTHAAGVVIAPDALVNYTPLQYGPGRESVITQYDMKAVSDIGLLKMDFLGLQNLDIIATCLDLIKRHRGEAIDLLDLRYDDPNTYELVSAADTHGVFQLEGSGMRRMLQEMKPQTYEDLTAAVALFRPGPMQNIPAYLARKDGREPITYMHERLEPILKETYGIMIYQEQVMMAARALAGFTLSEADILRSAMGKKDQAKMAQQREKFIQGCVQNGITQEKGEELFDAIDRFAQYGFNKCLAGSTVLYEATSGERTTIAELFRHPRQFLIHGLGEDGRLRARPVTDVMWNGRKPVFELVTAQGRRIKATATHRFRTLDGWRQLSDLGVGDRVAVPRTLPVPSEKSWPQHELVVLAGLLAEGNTCHPSTLYFYNNDAALIADFMRAAAEFSYTLPRVSRRRGRYEVRLNSGLPAHVGRLVGESLGASGEPWRSGVFRWAESLGVLGLKADDKSVPSEVFELCDEDVALFLGRLWAGDGFIASGANLTPYYATSSFELASDVRDLLLRFGIMAGIHEKRFSYRGDCRFGYTVHLIGEDSATRFVNAIAPHCLGREADLGELRRHLSGPRRGASNSDVIPVGVRALVHRECEELGLSFESLDALAGVGSREVTGYVPPTKQGFRRETIDRLGVAVGSAKLRDLAGSDVFWDRIVSIESGGVEDTYDLTVDVDHNFVADGFVVHNSHSAAYAMISYQTAYFKANYPAEYMTALLIHMAGNADRVAAAIVDCKKRNLEVLPPDINESGSDFTITPAGQIRFGLNAIKNVGRHAVEHLVREREENGLYQSLDDLCERVTGEADINSRALESLIRSGACDTLGERNQLLAVVDLARQRAERLRRDRESGQISLFGTAESSEDRSTDYGVTATPMSAEDRLSYEKEYLGLYLSDHPLNRIQGQLAGLTDAQAIDITTELTGTEVRVGGLVRELRRVVTRKGQIMAYAEVEDLTGVIDVTLFPRAYDQYRQLFEPDRIVVLQGTVEPQRGGGPRNNQPQEDLDEPEAEEIERATLIADFAWAWDDPECVPVERQRQMHVEVPESDPAIVDQLMGVIAGHPGEDELLLHFQVAGRQVTVRAGDRFRVSAVPALKQAFDAIFGREVSRLETVRPRSRGGNGSGNGSNGSNGRGGDGEHGRNGRRGG